MNEIERAIVRVEIGGEWKLEDLNLFARDYEDLYAFVFHLKSVLEHSELAEVRALFERVPDSGFAALHFYAALRFLVPERAKPFVTAMRYGSPGFLDLQHAAEIATIIGLVVSIYRTMGGGPPSPPRSSGGVSVNITNSSNVTIIVNALGGEDAGQPEIRKVIPHQRQREAILRTVRNKVRRLSGMWSRGLVTGLSEQFLDSDP